MSKTCLQIGITVTENQQQKSMCVDFIRAERRKTAAQATIHTIVYGDRFNGQGSDKLNQWQIIKMEMSRANPRGCRYFAAYIQLNVHQK